MGDRNRRIHLGASGVNAVNIERYTSSSTDVQVIVLLPILVVMPFEISQTDFMLWGTVYVVAKWTVGLWAFRRVKVYFAQRRIQPT